MNKIKRSWILLGCAWSAIRKNKRLLWFPMVTLFLTLPVFVFFLATPLLWPTGHAYTDAAHWQAVAERFVVPYNPVAKTTATTGMAPATQGANAGKSVTASMDMHMEAATVKPFGLVYLTMIYLVSMFLATFFNVAFFGEIIHALNGHEVSIKRGLHLAATRWRAILYWSLLAGIVGIVIKQLEERFGFVGRWVCRLVGLTWSVATIFVVPLIIREAETTNPVKLLQSSAATLKKTWGESLVGLVGLHAVGWIVVLGSLVPILFCSIVLMITLNNVWMLLAGIGLWLVGVIAFCYLLDVCEQIYRCALYIYASEGVIPLPFDHEMMEQAWNVSAGQK